MESVFSTFNFFLQKLSSGDHVLSKGTLALFYGGTEILPHVSDSVKSSNSSLYFLVILFFLIQLLLLLYKKYRFKKTLAYEQKIQQVVMTGFRNVFNQIIIIIVFFTFITMFALHMFLSDKQVEVEKAEQNGSYGFWMLILLLTIMTIIPFKNPKLRYQLQLQECNSPPP